MGVLAE